MKTKILVTESQYKKLLSQLNEDKTTKEIVDLKGNVKLESKIKSDSNKK
jgi:hypothetical protein